MPLYHFTDPRNIPSIRRHGLLSWTQLKTLGKCHFPASNKLSRNLDTQKGLQNYVRLCLHPNHPMAFRALMDWRIRDVVWLTVSDAVINWHTTLFSDMNAASRRARINSNPQTALESPDPQAEVLVEGSIETQWIEIPNVSLFRILRCHLIPWPFRSH